MFVAAAISSSLSHPDLMPAHCRAKAATPCSLLQSSGQRRHSGEATSARASCGGDGGTTLFDILNDDDDADDFDDWEAAAPELPASRRPGRRAAGSQGDLPAETGAAEGRHADRAAGADEQRRGRSGRSRDDERRPGGGRKAEAGRGRRSSSPAGGSGSDSGRRVFF